MLTVTTRLSDGEEANLPAGEYAVLHVADTGEGMAPDVIERAMEPFFSTKAVGEGSGMGLAMVFGVISQSGGTVRIDSAIGRGTAIILYLPLSNAPPATLHAKEQLFGRIRLDGRRIALVDDDPQVRSALADLLSSAGAQVLEASDGPQGLALVRTEAPDVLVIDYAMPGMSGAEVVEHLRDEANAIPALLITGFADSRVLARIETANVRILRKPFETEDMLTQIARLGEVAA